MPHTRQSQGNEQCGCNQVTGRHMANLGCFIAGGLLTVVGLQWGEPLEVTLGAVRPTLSRLCELCRVWIG